MNPLHRYLRFNAVGALGMAVQLSTLALLNKTFPHHYLLTTTAALELTLLHNFLGHLHYTWRDRPTTSPSTQLLRFHLTNGLTSLIGNLTLMRLLVHNAHLPVLAANTAAILICSVANFTLSNAWAFGPNAQSRTPAPPLIYPSKSPCPTFTRSSKM